MSVPDSTNLLAKNLPSESGSGGTPRVLSDIPNQNTERPA
jgi:hypothetical protein